MKIKIVAVFLLIVSGLFACNQVEVFDENKIIENKKWRSTSKVSFKLNITNIDIKYDFVLKLRHTPSYRYSNIFILFYVTNPEKKTSTERIEFTLAEPDGEWIGHGVSVLAYKSIFKTGFKFPKAGIYTIEIEQNMRDNPLEGIMDVGLALVRSEN